MVDVNIVLDDEISYIEEFLLKTTDDYFQSSLNSLYRLAVRLEADEFIIKRIKKLLIY